MPALRILAIVGGSLLGLLALLFVALQTAPGQRALAAMVTSAGVEVVGLSGFFPTDLRIARLAVRDRDGPWLTAESVALRWSFASLFDGRVTVDSLRARRLAVLRMPLSEAEAPAPNESGPPNLPIGIDLRSLAIDDLHLAAALAKVDSHWRIAGNALLPSDLAAGSLKLDGERTDGPRGRFTADIRFDASRRTIDGSARLDEGQGGVVAVLLDRPDIAELTMRLAAHGDVREGKAEIEVTAGDAARAKGEAVWQQEDGATALSVRLDAAGPGLPASPIADAVRQPIALVAQAVIDDRAVRLDRATLTAGPLGLEAQARFDRAAERLEGKLSLHADEPGPLASLLDGATWRGLRLGATVDLAALTDRPQGTIVLDGSADAVSFAAIDTRLPAPGAVTLAAEIGVGDGGIEVKSLDLGSPLASVQGKGSYAPSTGMGDAKATVALPSLAPLSQMAGRPLVGSATVDVTASIDRDGLKLGWRAVARDLGAEGLPAAMVSAPVSLFGAATLGRDRMWTLSDVRLASEGGTLDLSGRGQGGAGELDLAVDLPALAALQAGVGGSANVTAHIGFGDRTTVRLDATLLGLAHGQLTSRRLAIAASGALDATGAASGEARASGDLAGHPLSLDGRFALAETGGLRVPALRARWASLTLDADDLAITGRRTSGYARLNMPRLEDASPLAGTRLAGALEAEVTADDRTTNGRVTIRLQGKDLRAGDLAIGALDLRGTVDEPMTTGTTNATLSASSIAGAADINRLSATATGDRQAIVVALQAAGARTSASAEARVEHAGEDLVVGLNRFEGRHAGIPVVLAAPTRIHLAGPSVAIEPTSLRVGGGRIAARGTLAPTASDLQVEIAGLPLSLIEAFAPGAGLDGTLQARLRVQGSSTAPVVEGTYDVAALRLRRPEAALLPPVSIRGTGSVTGRQASIDARLGSGGATGLTLKGRAILPSGPAPLSGSAAIAGTIDLAPFAPLLGNDVRNVAGRLRPDLTVEFAGSRVTGTGTLDFSGGALSLPESGLRLSGGEGRLSLQGDTLQVQRLTFKAMRGGTVSAGGTLRLDTEQGVVPDLTVTSREALLVSRPDLMAIVTADLKITGATATGIDVAGPITIDRAEIAVGAAQSVSFPTIEVREIGGSGETASAPASGAATTPGRAAPSDAATPIRLKLAISAPQAVFVRGRGLDAEMGGQLDVGGTPAAPTVVGGLTLRRGEFNLLGRRLTFRRGVVSLDNLDRIDPRLDFVASTSVQSTTINVTVGGTSRAPTVEVSSVPTLPPDEVMAMLLFGKPTSRLSVFELAQAAQGLAELTGQPSGSGALTRLRRGLGLDRLSVNSGTSANAPVSLEAGRYVAPGVYVGARQGATGNSSRGVVQFEVLENVKIEGDIGADSNGRIGVKMEWDY